MKKNLLWFILGGLIFGTIGVGAAYVYTARDINYQPSDENWNVENVQEALTELKTDINTITNKVEGIERVYKAGEVELVALVSDDSFYTDNNGKYVLANSDTGRTLLADTSTYKSLASTSDCVGIVGQDSVITFGKNYTESNPRINVQNKVGNANLKWVGNLGFNFQINLENTDKKVTLSGSSVWNGYLDIYIDGVEVAHGIRIDQEEQSFDLNNNSTFQAVTRKIPTSADNWTEWSYNVKIW